MTNSKLDWTFLELALTSSCSHLCSTVAETYFTALDAGHEPDILPSILVDIARSPYLRDENVSRFDWAGETSTKLLDIGWIRVSEKLKQGMSSRVPRE